MTNEQLLNLLREAQDFVKDHPCCDINADLCSRIDAALAEPLDSTPPVLAWEADAVHGNTIATLDDQRWVGVGKGRWTGGWWWTAGGRADTEEEAKAKAVALVERIE